MTEDGSMVKVKKSPREKKSPKSRKGKDGEPDFDSQEDRIASLQAILMLRSPQTKVNIEDIPADYIESPSIASSAAKEKRVMIINLYRNTYFDFSSYLFPSRLCGSLWHLEIQKEG